MRFPRVLPLAAGYLYLVRVAIPLGCALDAAGAGTIARLRSRLPVLETKDVCPALAEIPVAGVFGVDDSAENGGLSCGQLAGDFTARADDQAGAVLMGPATLAAMTNRWFAAAWLIR